MRGAALRCIIPKPTSVSASLTTHTLLSVAGVGVRSGTAGISGKLAASESQSLSSRISARNRYNDFAGVSHSQRVLRQTLEHTERLRI